MEFRQPDSSGALCFRGDKEEALENHFLTLGDCCHVQQVRANVISLISKNKKKIYLFFLLPKTLKMEKEERKRETERERPLLTPLKEEEI